MIGFTHPTPTSTRTDMATRSGDGRDTERVLRLYEKEARKYDREMNFFDLLLFSSMPPA